MFNAYRMGPLTLPGHKATSGAARPLTAYLNALGYGNECSLINDPRVDPLGDAEQLLQQDEEEEEEKGNDDDEEARAGNGTAEADDGDDGDESHHRGGGSGGVVAGGGNCRLVVLHICGFPVPFVVTNRPVRAGDEALLPYSLTDYWQTLRPAVKRWRSLVSGAQTVTVAQLLAKRAADVAVVPLAAAPAATRPAVDAARRPVDVTAACAADVSQAGGSGNGRAPAQPDVKAAPPPPPVPDFIRAAVDERPTPKAAPAPAARKRQPTPEWKGSLFPYRMWQGLANSAAVASVSRVASDAGRLLPRTSADLFPSSDRGSGWSWRQLPSARNVGTAASNGQEQPRR